VSATYLLRFDDLCPTMDHERWDLIERAMFELDIRPIAAVVPDNRDPELVAREADPAFWERVRGWQAHGWTIAMHGYQHRYVTIDAGLVGLNRYSEFAGLPREEQLGKLRHGLGILEREGVIPSVWVAPAHSFDRVTVELLVGLGIRVVSDGLFVLPHRDRLGALWIPQQLWTWYWMPAGVWTICVHPNTLGASELWKLLDDIRTNRSLIADVASIERRYGERDRRLSDVVVPPLMRGLKAAKGAVSRVPGRAHPGTPAS
jgi:predicted deacetylase